MAFPGNNYAPPGTYTRTLFENPLSGALDALKIPVFIGEGNEYLVQRNLEVVRGSSKTLDQRIVNEDETGRAVFAVTTTGAVTLSDWDGVLRKFQVRNLPIVSGDGTGTTTNDRSDVSVTIDGQPIVVLSVDGAKGIIELAQAPKVGQVVRCTYFFNRTDTRITDDVSSQVTPDTAIVRASSGLADVNSNASTGATLNLHGDIKNAQGEVIVAANNVLLVTVDGTDYTVTIPAKSTYTMAQIANAISAAKAGSLRASTFINNFGHSTLSLTADHDLQIGDGSANALLGLTSGQSSNRTKTFFVFNGPIVDGSNGGVTTTDPSHVVVKVDGVQVVPTRVDGATRAVTLAKAPKPGAKVLITYWFNAWQDTFDYLAHTNVASVTSLGDVPDSSGFTQGADFILQNDRILWGTAVTVDAGVNTAGKEFFDEAQIQATLIDNKTFLSQCSAVVQSSGGVSRTSQVDFLLPFEPTLGNGRDTKLGQSLFQDVSNGRIDLPVNRPDVIDAYWGYDVQDALSRGKVQVLKVEGSTITLAEPVPVGAKVYASFYYNLLTDQKFTLSVVGAGASGVGTYTIKDEGENSVYGATYRTSSKGAGLTGVTVVFPSGSELSPDLRFESVSGEDFSGPVEEVVTVQFATKYATPAKYATPGADTYEFIQNQSDRFRVVVDSTEIENSTAGIDLQAPGPHDGGFFANLVSEEIVYEGGSGATVGKSFTLDDDLDIILTLDGVEVEAKVPAVTNADVNHIVDAINEAANGHQAEADGGGAATITLNAARRSTIDGYYVGWKVVIGNGAALATAGQALEVTAYNGTTGVATVSGNWAGGAVAASDPYRIYNPSTLPVIKGATRFNGPVTLYSAKHDNLRFAYVGATSGTFSDQIDLTDGASDTFASAAALAAQIQTKLDASVAGAGAGFAGLRIGCDADADGRLVFTVQLPGVDEAGYLQFLNAQDGGPADNPEWDFAVLAGLDTGAAVGDGQAALLIAPVARAYTLNVGGGFKPHDRLILRNRLLPGKAGSMAADDLLAQCELSIGSGNGLDVAGLTAGDQGEAGEAATVRPASLLGRVGFIGGMDTNSEPVVTFYDGTGVRPKNSEFEFRLDGVPVVVSFTASDSGTAQALGPATGTSNGSILDDIIDAMAAVPGAPWGTAADIYNLGLVRQEGAGIRITSALSDVTSAVVIGNGSANSVLGFSDGQAASRKLVSAKKLASALMAHRHQSFATWMHSFSAVTSAAGSEHFAALALASVVEDASGAEYLYLQSLTAGTASSVTLRDPVVGGVVTRSALAYHTGLGAENLDGATGEAAVDGFFVTSNNPNGSGSVNDSVLNNGTGQDGIVGQTYRDKVTGLTFTILPRGWHDNPDGPWQAYPTGATATLRFNVSKTFTCNANLPHNAINGVELKVSNTLNVGVGDTAIVTTHERGGNEPAIGDVYYVTYTYQKQDFGTSFYTKMSAIESAFGPISPENPVSLAAYLAILNGAVVVGIKQVSRAEGSNYASLTDYKAAVTELEGTLPGQVRPDIIVPLRGDSTELFQILRKSNEVQSSIRYKSERTSIIGMSAGSTPQDAQNLATALKSSRMRLVYPDMAVIQLTDGTGFTKEHLVDGPMVAAALAGSVVSPNYDVATPWTGRRLVGFSKLARVLDAVEMNQVAQRGVTVMEDRSPVLRVRHGLTTDMTSILTKTPTVVQISDEVQRQSRAVLENFIGIKFLPGILTQVEGRLAMMLKALVAQQIIAAYTGVKARVSADDQTVAEVEAYYSPVFPLLYLVMTFHLRASV